MATNQVGEPARTAPRLARTTWLACLVLAMLPIAIARADSGQTSEEVAQEILRLQDKADAAAQEFSELDTETLTLAGQVAEGQAALDQAAAAFNSMQSALTAVAVNRFMGGGISEGGLLGQNPVLGLQMDALANIAIGAGDANLDDFETLQTDLENKQANLTALQDRNERAKARLADKQQSLNDQLAQLAALEVRLKDAEVKRAYDEQVAARRAAEKEAADKAAAKAAADAAAAARATSSSPGDGQTNTTTKSAGSGATPAVAAAAITPIATPTASTAPATTSNDSGGSDSTDNTEAPAPTTTAPPSHPAAVLIGGDWFCPIAGPNAFGHSFGDPRPGGRIHQGVDMMSPYGTPLVAVVAGFAQMKTNSLGGNAIGLKAANGDYYYYAHLSSWEGPSREVQAGDVIGYVGHTGDTSVDHLHFEIHPGGGAAVDPYDTLRAHC